MLLLLSSIVSGNAMWRRFTIPAFTTCEMFENVVDTVKCSVKVRL